jgi:hypothetical protein
MLRLSLLLLLAPLSVLTLPNLYPTDQLVPQYPVSLGIQDALAPAAPPQSSAIQLVYQFKDPVALENLVARSNGHLVLTVSNQPNIYELDPNAKGKLSPTLLYSFPGVSSLTGIAEYAPDMFAVVAGNWSSVTFQAVPGSFSIWSVDMNTAPPTVKMITAIPEAAALNGATILGGKPNIVLIADSALGAVWRLNVATGTYSMAMRYPSFTNATTAFPRPIGINGLCVFGNMLYFLNSAQGSYGRVPINADGSSAGEVQILARVKSGAYDDFDMDWEGTAWIATHANALNEVTIEGKQRNTTADPDFEMLQPTGAIFGRGSKQEEKTLYLTTGGGKAGGQVVSVQTWLI